MGTWRPVLTCVIGARGADGSVVVSDKRILREYEVNNESKVHLLWEKAVLAGAGSTALLDQFAEAIRSSKIPSITNLSGVVASVEDIVHDLRKRYEPRLGRDYGIEAILLGLEKFNKGDPYLRHIFGTGISEDVKEYAIIGHGAPYVSTLFRLLYDPMLTAEELGVLGYFIISSIVGLGLDQTLGMDQLGPDVVVLKPNEEPRFMNPLGEEFSKARQSLQSLGFRFKLVRSVWPKVPQAYENLPGDLL